MSHPAHTLEDRLLSKLETLRQGFEPVANAPSIKEMVRLFIDLLQKEFEKTDVSLFHKAGDNGWVILSGKEGETAKAVSILSERKVGFNYVDDARTTISVVHPLADKTFLGILLTRNDASMAFDEPDRILLQLLLLYFDRSYQSLVHRRNEKDMLFSLNHRVLQLNSLIDTGIEISKLQREGSLHQLALVRGAALTNASRGVLTVATKGKDVERYVFPEGDDQYPDVKFRIESSFEFFDSTYKFELMEKESRSGIIPFDETDQMLLNALTRQVHASLENRYLLQQTLDKQKIEQELAVAASIQQRILPESLPAIDGYDVHATNIPSKSVGGDYYDCIPLDNGQVALIIADVSGKGVPAALLVSSFHAYLHAYLEHSVSLIPLTQRLNSAICAAATDDKFITAFIGLLDPKSGKVECLSAGHNPVYFLRRDKTVKELSVGGVALGMLQMDFPYQSEEITMEPGESMLLYTDGVTEAMNEKRELYDEVVPLKRFALENRERPSSKEFIDTLVSDVKRFSGSAPQADDITALYICRR